MQRHTPFFLLGCPAGCAFWGMILVILSANRVASTCAGQADLVPWPRLLTASVAIAFRSGAISSMSLLRLCPPPPPQRDDCISCVAPKLYHVCHGANETAAKHLPCGSASGEVRLLGSKVRVRVGVWIGLGLGLGHAFGSGSGLGCGHPNAARRRGGTVRRARLLALLQAARRVALHQPWPHRGHRRCRPGLAMASWGWQRDSLVLGGGGFIWGLLTFGIR